MEKKHEGMRTIVCLAQSSNMSQCYLIVAIVKRCFHVAVVILLLLST